MNGAVTLPPEEASLPREAGSAPFSVPRLPAWSWLLWTRLSHVPPWQAWGQDSQVCASPGDTSTHVISLLEGMAANSGVFGDWE